jgi:mRNA-degrading endonuclease YafQ of YafQ-DinJ toxin-antitoxin module
MTMLKQIEKCTHRSCSFDCHINFDWVLIYETDDEAVTLQRTGAHSDLFG